MTTDEANNLVGRTVQNNATGRTFTVLNITSDNKTAWLSGGRYIPLDTFSGNWTVVHPETAEK